jgi:hypothetical protein
LEFAFARNVDLKNGFDISSLRLLSGVTRSDRLPISSGEVNWSQVNFARISMLLGFGESPNPAEYASEALQSRVLAYGAYIKNDLTGALGSWRRDTREPTDLNELIMVAECTANEAGPEADAYIEKLRELLPAEADAILVSLLWRRGQVDEAADLLAKVLQRLRDDPWLKTELIERTLILAGQIVDHSSNDSVVARIYDALRKPFCVYNGDNSRQIVSLRCGIKLDKGQYGRYCLPVLESLEPNVPWRSTFLQIRAASYRATNHPLRVQAERDVKKFLSQQPARLDVLAPIEKPGLQSETLPTTATR